MAVTTINGIFTFAKKRDYDTDICESNNALTTETGIAGQRIWIWDLDRATEGPSRVNIENHQIVDINPQWAYLVLV